MRLPKLKTTLIVSAVAVVAAIAVPVASAAGGWYGCGWGGSAGTAAATAATAPSPSSWCGGGIWNGTGAWGGTGMWGTGHGASWLEKHPAAFQAWLTLMTKQRQAMASWWATFKADPTSSAAQQALYDVWQDCWNARQSFYEQYAGGATWTCPALGAWGGWQMMGGGMMGGWGWNAAAMWGSGYGASWMIHHPAAMSAWMHLRAGQLARVRAWWKNHSSAPTSSAAQHALATMRAHELARVKRFFKHHRLSASKARLRYGAGGWMGMGGMWGGWGW